MNPKILLGLALVLSGVIFSTTIANAQPGGGHTYTSLEARIIQAPVVFRGTITNLSDFVIHTNNQFTRQGVFTNKPVARYDIHNYTLALRVDEVFKGNMPRQPLELNFNGVGKCGDIEKWADERASFLLFVNEHESEKSIATNFFAVRNFIFLGPTLPGRTDELEFNRLQRVFDMDMTLFTKPEDILARARVFARKRMNTATFHTLYLPELSILGWSECYLTVPVEPSLERTAKRLIAAPEDFISKTNTDQDHPANQDRCLLRSDGVSALQYFKSAQNIKLLKSLLEAPDFWAIKDWSTQNRDLNVTNKIYSVRNKAYEVLTAWGVDVPRPVTEETIPAK